MASHKSAEKRARQALKRRARNRAVRSGVRTTVKEVQTAIGGGDASSARSQLGAAERSLRKAASKGVMKKKTASRAISRLSRAVNRAEKG